MLYAKKRPGVINTKAPSTKYINYTPDEEHEGETLTDGFNNLEYGYYLVTITKRYGTSNCLITSFPRILTEASTDDDSVEENN